MLKIRRPLGRLIFNMGIAIPGKTVFLIETAPRWLGVLLESLDFQCNCLDAVPRYHSGYGLSQWETMLQGYVVSHGLRPWLEWCLCSSRKQQGPSISFSQKYHPAIRYNFTLVWIHNNVCHMIIYDTTQTAFFFFIVYHKSMRRQWMDNCDTNIFSVARQEMWLKLFMIGALLPLTDFSPSQVVEDNLFEATLSD